MNYKDLLEKYNLLLNENNRLIEENNRLKAQLGITKFGSSQNSLKKITTEYTLLDDKSANNISFSGVNNSSDSILKIKLFMSLFKGREDVYAKRWENKNKTKSGYSPVCLNEWQSGICAKPKNPCSKCKNKLYAALDEGVIENHLRGNIVAGIYPMLPDETCYFLAIDFDEEDWQKDISIVREVCSEFDIPLAVERSQSGNGGHIWFFFKNPLSAALARKFGTALITFSMNRRHKIRFKSYDRLFPSQDTMPKGGFGNLIALPFQKSARKNNNCEFIDENFNSYSDQWLFLSSIQKIPENRIESIIEEVCHGHELGILKIDEEENPKPWEIAKKVNLRKNDFPEKIDIVKLNMLFVPNVSLRINQFQSSNRLNYHE